ncbi:MAG TPA: hypothetical protein VFE54_11150 [Mucilaginibacter sp.]|jgi:hypothetical protein|nr:hypothetical protein [Mucilaginibacter sp.]
MLQQLNLKKEYGLVAAAIVALLLCYQLAFKKTFIAWQLNQSLKQQLAQSADVSYQPGYTERKNINLDKIISLYKADTINFRSNVLGTISSLAERENVKLSEVPSKDPVYHTSQLFIEKLDFEGDYFSLVKTLNHLQSVPQIGVIRAATMKTVGTHSSNDEVKKTVLEVYLEIAVN